MLSLILLLLVAVLTLCTLTVMAALDALAARSVARQLGKPLPSWWRGVVAGYGVVWRRGLW